MHARDLQLGLNFLSDQLARHLFTRRMEAGWEWIEDDQAPIRPGILGKSGEGGEHVIKRDRRLAVIAHVWVIRIINVGAALGQDDSCNLLVVAGIAIFLPLGKLSRRKGAKFGNGSVIIGESSAVIGENRER